MIRIARKRPLLLLMVASLALVACQLRRPTPAPSRVLEPQLLEPQVAEQPGAVAKIRTPPPFDCSPLNRTETSAAVFCTGNRMVS